MTSTQDLTGHEAAAELADWPGSPLSTLHYVPSSAAATLAPSDEWAEENRYVVRFNLPGLDAGKDIQVSVDAHVLTVRVRKPADNGQQAGSEPLTCRVNLPEQANDRDVAAIYWNGNLDVNVGWRHGPTARDIDVLTLADTDA
jgi:HSP20 family protein